MNDLDDRLGRILSSVEILSLDAVRIGGGETFHGASFAAMPGINDETFPIPATLRRLRDVLATLLYIAAYSRVYKGEPVTAADLPPSPKPDPVFATSLSAANTGRTRWDGGWRIYQADPNGNVHVHKGEAVALMQPGQYFTGGFGVGSAGGVGGLAQIFVAHESMQLQPFYYYALGETVMSDHDAARIARLYFHLDATEAAWAVGALTSALNRYRLPFRLKTPTDPQLYHRTDGLVLYVPRRFAAAALRVVLTMRAELEQRLLPGHPLFAKDLLPGLSSADDPANGESFGQMRCRLMADAIVTSARPDLATRLDALRARFQLAGLDLSRPHLATGLAELNPQETAEAA